jgi:hypothetical protein
MADGEELDLAQVNMSHTIHHLAFGADSLLLHSQETEALDAEDNEGEGAGGGGGVRRQRPSQQQQQQQQQQQRSSAYAALTGRRGDAGQLIEYYITAVPTLLQRCGKRVF